MLLAHLASSSIPPCLAYRFLGRSDVQSPLDFRHSISGDPYDAVAYSTGHEALHRAATDLGRQQSRLRDGYIGSCQQDGAPGMIGCALPVTDAPIHRHLSWNR